MHHQPVRPGQWIPHISTTLSLDRSHRVAVFSAANLLRRDRCSRTDPRGGGGSGDDDDEEEEESQNRG